MAHLSNKNIDDFIEYDILDEDGELGAVVDEHALEFEFTRAAALLGMSLLSDWLLAELGDSSQELHDSLDRLRNKIDKAYEDHKKDFE